MFTPKLSVVRFAAEDVIATSIPAGYSAQSYPTSSANRWCVSKDGGFVFTNEGSNLLDGEEVYEADGRILTVGNWYHYDTTNTFPSYKEIGSSGWFTCTDESHHAI